VHVCGRKRVDGIYCEKCKSECYFLFFVVNRESNTHMTERAERGRERGREKEVTKRMKEIKRENVNRIKNMPPAKRLKTL